MRSRAASFCIVAFVVGAGSSRLALAELDVPPDGEAIDDRDHDRDDSSTAAPSGWGSIVGACLGVLFGGAIAVWQIRGRQRS